MAPMETQVREHQLQLRRRLESIKRIHKATDTLEDRITGTGTHGRFISCVSSTNSTASTHICTNPLMHDANRDVAFA